MQNLIEERDQEIKTIQSQMVDINQLFVDLHNLVAQQREFVGTYFERTRS
jgi:t-SNARE complex subunit (syntaxin)